MKTYRNGLCNILSSGILLLTTLLSVSASASPWQFEITPYLWALNMDGQVGVGPVTANVNETFSDLFRHLNFAAMVYGSAHKDDFGLYGSALYAALSDSGTVGPHSGISVKAYEDYGIFGAGASYIVAKHEYSNLSRIIVEPYAGARFTLVNTRLKVANLSTARDNQHWTDPVIGLNLKYEINKQWSIRLMGDVGGTSTNRQYSYSATGLIGYTPVSFWTNTTTSLGYHYLKQRYMSGSGFNSFYWNMNLFGPVIAISIRF
ncbi:MAG: hypothetical protein V4501_07865 [Pseudomonadota bacterium]